MIDIMIENNNGYGHYLFLDYNETIVVYEEEQSELIECKPVEKIEYYYLPNSIISELFLTISSYIKDKIILRLFIFLNFY
jgi:hypothetical protein